MARSRGPVCPGFAYGARRGRIRRSLACACSFSPRRSLAPERAAAQGVEQSASHFQPRPPQPKPPPAPANGPMLVQATEIKYDYTNNTVAAVGNVQIYYNGATIEADKVIYNQKTKRLLAQGNVRLTEADGKITYGQIIDLTDDYRDGFVDSLRLETPTTRGLPRARRSQPRQLHGAAKRRLYRLRALQGRSEETAAVAGSGGAHHPRQSEKMLYFEDARVEFFGVPLAYVPFMSAPDPTVKRKSGFLFPTVSRHVAIRLRRRGSRITGRWRRTTTSPSAPW